MRPRTFPIAVGCIEKELQMIDLKDELAELERQLAQAEKTLPFVPPGDYERTRAQLEEIRDTIHMLKACPGQWRVQ
jgi:hypothetical protein